MGLVTLFLLGAFALVYISAMIENKPAFVDKALGFIRDNMSRIALIGVIFGFAMIFMTPLMENNTSDLLVRLFANCMLVVMALPYAFEQLVKKFESDKNDALIGETRNFIKLITDKEKLVGIIGTVATLLLFAVLFR